ncbi:MAG: MATE family efflux transporter, partial [Bacteroidetes bacterium]|nr:MATE family efflux transporter [Bacteroidota bacterium]
MIPGKLHLRLKSLWSDIRESVQGTEQDFTSGRISRAILLLSIPMVLEMVMESVFALVDIFFVSRLGPGAVVTVGITESLLTIIYALAVGFSVGTTALISRRIGEKNAEGAAVGAVQAILAGIMMAVVIGITGVVFSKDFLRLMGATPDIVESGYMYTRIMMGGNIVIMLLFIINAVFRSAGDAAISMR